MHDYDWRLNLSDLSAAFLRACAPILPTRS